MSESGMGAWRSPGTEGVKLVPPCRINLSDGKTIFGEHVTELKHMGRSYKDATASFFKEGPHSFSETLISTVDDLFRTRWKFRTGTKHSFKVSSKIGFDIASDIGIP